MKAASVGTDLNDSSTAGNDRMDRRQFLGFAALTGLATTTALSAEAVHFDRSALIEIARALAAKPFAFPDPPLPDALRDLGYSQYQGIRFRENARLFTQPPTAFSVDLLHSGFIFNVPVEIFVVEDGMARQIAYSPELFSFQHSEPPAPETPLEFAGFRARTTLNSPDVMDEFLVFAGASYFRAVAKGQVYGLSARGLAIGTATDQGEEFPFFRGFWLERPIENRLVIHALLDGPSATGAYRFTVRPGDETRIDVEVALFARADINELGVAPLTSMFLFDAKDRFEHDDYRPSIHDSDGLAIWNGSGEHLWRPLRNPRLLQVSAFADTSPIGFGLVQRERRFPEYEDLEALYHRRPSVWVEPIGDWGRGALKLVEIPSAEEIHDNIVAFWSPEAQLAAGEELSFTYRLTWGWQGPPDGDRLRVVRTLSGAGSTESSRRFVIDFAPVTGTAPPSDSFSLSVFASVGAISNPILLDNPEIGGVRATFEVDLGGADLAELRASLARDEAPASEVWVYRWTT